MAKDSVRKVNLFVVGMPKTGTTSLYHYFKQHPEIYAPEVKELNYFAPVLKKELANKNKILEKHFYMNEEKYMNYYKDSVNEKYLADVTPIYLYSEIAAKGIHKFNPDAKFIAIFREPVDFLYSLHLEYLTAMLETEPDFLKAIGTENSKKNNNLVLNYSEWLNYSRHIKKFLRLFPKKNIKIIFFRNFAQDTSNSFRDIEKFLGISQFDDIDFKVYNKSKITRVAWLRKIVEHPVFWINARKILPNKILENLKKIYYAVVLKEFQRQPLPENAIKNLKLKYKSNVVDFQDILKSHGFISEGFDLIKY